MLPDESSGDQLRSFLTGPEVACPSCGYSAAGLTTPTCPECGGLLGTRERAELRGFLSGRDAPCPACAYSLRDLQSDVCPECGERLELRVGMVEPRMKLWIAGLVGLAAGAGFNALLLVYIVTEMMRQGFRIRDFVGAFLAVNAGGLLVEGACLGAWLLLRRRIRNLPAHGRAALVVGVWVLALIDVMVFAYNIK